MYQANDLVQTTQWLWEWGQVSPGTGEYNVPFLQYSLSVAFEHFSRCDHIYSIVIAKCYL